MTPAAGAGFSADSLRGPGSEGGGDPSLRVKTQGQGLLGPLILSLFFYFLEKKSGEGQRKRENMK